MITAGIDIGSATSKAVLLQDGKTILSRVVIPVGTGTSGPIRAFEAAMETAGLTREDLAYVMATGYGRNHFPEANQQLSEITCHARGVFYTFPDAGTVIDIGGQDAKVIRMGPNGTVLSFIMNDKCAAGTGRFLEVMARVLETQVDELAALAGGSAHEIDISNTCTVFAESEVISQLSTGSAREDIAAGIIKSVVRRVSGLARRAGIQADVVMTGGVSLNPLAVDYLEAELGCNIVVSPNAQVTGALGAAIIAWNQLAQGNRP